MRLSSHLRNVTALLSLTLLLPAIARAEGDKVILPVRVATLHGDGAHLDGTLIENWDEIETFVSWRVKLSAGELEVVVRQASGSGSVGNSYQIEIAEQRLSGTVKGTGGWRMIEDVSLGRMQLDKAGEFEVILRPLKKKGQSVMNLAGITLRGPAAEPPPTPGLRREGSRGVEKGNSYQSNPLRPRAFGGKGAEGLKKEIPAMGLVKWGSGNFRQG